jgi:hypothetical protein
MGWTIEWLCFESQQARILFFFRQGIPVVFKYTSKWNKYLDFFFIIKPNRRTNFTNLFWHETLHVSGSSSVYHQEFIHCTLRNSIYHTGLKRAFEQDQDGSWSCSKSVFKTVWYRTLPSVQWINSWWWAAELPETCRVSFQRKFVKLVRLLGFIIKKFVAMHGHMNIKKYLDIWFIYW